MTLSASKSVCGQELDIVVDYDPKEREVVDILEICINKVDVSPTLLHFGAEDAILVTLGILLALFADWILSQL